MATVPHVASGDIITSTAWNNMADEINLKATTADMNTRVSKAGDIMTGPLRINNALITTGSISANSFSALDPATNLPYLHNSINMANNIENATKWLHIGGITDTDGIRRIALYANRTFVAGNLGIGTTTPEYSLDVNGTVRLGGFQANEGVSWPNVVWLRNVGSPGGDWDEGLIKIPSNLTSNGKSGFGVHFHESRSFSFYTTGWTKVLNIHKNRISVNAGIHFENQPLQWNNPDYPKFGQFSDTLGNASIFNDGSPNYSALMILGRKLSTGRRFIQMWDDVDVKGRLRPSAGGGETAGIIFPLDAFGGTGDRASIQYISRGGEATSLEIKNLNDVDDNIEIKASGQVIITNSFSPSDERLKENIEPRQRPDR